MIDRHERTPRQRQQDAQGNREDDADDGDHQRQHEAAPFVGGHMLQNGAADQKLERQDREADEHEHRPIALAWHAIDQQRGGGDHEEDERQINPPTLAARIKSIEKLAEPIGDHDPTGARLGTIVSGSGIRIDRQGHRRFACGIQHDTRSNFQFTAADFEPRIRQIKGRLTLRRQIHQFDLADCRAGHIAGNEYVAEHEIESAAAICRGSWLGQTSRALNDFEFDDARNPEPAAEIRLDDRPIDETRYGQIQQDYRQNGQNGIADG